MFDGNAFYSLMLGNPIIIYGITKQLIITYQTFKCSKKDTSKTSTQEKFTIVVLQPKCQVNNLTLEAIPTYKLIFFFGAEYTLKIEFRYGPGFLSLLFKNYDRTRLFNIY